jgi:hypothetical protein
VRVADLTHVIGGSCSVTEDGVASSVAAWARSVVSVTISDIYSEIFRGERVC